MGADAGAAGGGSIGCIGLVVVADVGLGMLQPPQLTQRSDAAEVGDSPRLLLFFLWRRGW